MSVLQDLETLILPAAKLKTDGVPSASIALLENGKITSHVITTGKEDSETVYQPCSISKAITAIAVARLVDLKQITYETKAINHLSQSAIDCLVDSQTQHLLEQVTVEMLLSHRSGLSQGGFPGYAGQRPTVEDVLAGRHPANTPRMQFLSFPDAEFSYSGGGFTVLQLVLEDIVKKPFTQLMHDIVLQPLDMTRSFYGDPPEGETNFAKAYWTGNTAADPEQGYHGFVEQAAAGLWTTPTDLLKAVSALQNSLHTDDKGFLSTATAKKMLERRSHGMGRFMGGFARGWEANNTAFQHNGFNSPGYNTVVLGFHGGAVNSSSGEEPTSQSKEMARNGIAILTNSMIGHDVAIQQIISAIFYLKGWPKWKDISAQFGKTDDVPYAAPEGTAVEEDWREWVGKWGNWTIADENGPVIAFGSSKSMRLKVAAAPVAKLGGGKRELVFKAEGMRLGVRFTWDNDERVVQVLQKPAETLVLKPEK